MLESPGTGTANSGLFSSVLTSPQLWLVIFLCLLAAMLSYPVFLMIGPMYWDTFIYLDAAGRIAQGQTPIVDFFAPVGPLGYYLFALFEWLFPKGNPLLIADWCILVVAAPAMSLVLVDIGSRSRAVAWLLLAGFMIFAALPFNVFGFYPYPGVEGFGIYNRQSALLMYLLTAAVFFVDNRSIRLALFIILTLALFLTKITGFISGGLVLAFAFACGLIRVRTAIMTAIVFLAVLGVWQLYDGTIGYYIQDILALTTRNEGVLLPRFLTATSHFTGIVIAGGLLGLYLIICDMKDGAGRFVTQMTGSSIDDSAFAIHRDWLWLGVLLFAGLFFETQNTGSHAFIIILPGVLKIWLNNRRRQHASTPVLVLLIAFMCVPIVGSLLHKAIRTTAVSLMGDNYALENRNLGTIGQIIVKDVSYERAERLKKHYEENVPVTRRLSEEGEMPSFLLYSEPGFQAMWLMMHDELIDAIEAYERENNVTFDTIFTLDFTNIVPFVMNRKAPEHVAIGADPFRAIPPLDEQTTQAVRDTDLILSPKCPVTPAILLLEQIYRPALDEHRKIELTGCFDAYVLNTNAPAQ